MSAPSPGRVCLMPSGICILGVRGVQYGQSLEFKISSGVDALFEFYVDGDAGVDPNAMTLWFSQASLGLPAKVTGISDLLRIYSYLHRSITGNKASLASTRMSSNAY